MISRFYIGIYGFSDMKNNVIVMVITMVIVSKPPILIFALKKSGPAFVLGSPVSIISMGCPSVVYSGSVGKSLCFQT